MKKNIMIEGMSCAHCQGKVEKALNGLTGVEAKVDLKKKMATVKLDADISDDTLRSAVQGAGFSVVSIEEKKGIFGK